MNVQVTALDPKEFNETLFDAAQEIARTRHGLDIFERTVNGATEWFKVRFKRSTMDYDEMVNRLTRSYAEVSGYNPDKVFFTFGDPNWNPQAA